jgi:hypothetical protein
VQGDDRREIELREDVAVEHHDRVAQCLAGKPDGAAGAERRRLDDITDGQSRFAAVAEHLFDTPRLIVEAEDHLVDLGHLLEQIELVVEKRPIEDRHDRFWCVNGQRTQTRALAAGEQNRFHRNHRCYHADTGR